jgi:hypothetical protein
MTAQDSKLFEILSFQRFEIPDVEQRFSSQVIYIYMCVYVCVFQVDYFILHFGLNSFPY